MSMILPQTIQDLSLQTKRDAVYLSKFVASPAIGLYDAGLNYIWNEVVVSLRAKVNIYGLDLFYDALERPYLPFFAFYHTATNTSQKIPLTFK
ncbi:hypothetical protein [Psychrobacillus antarcticus]|uniref:hypothetical protein n=1 Tax=Psychrobacillus antarcticus TaxID=2879115 RepID=UPI002407A19F|nr:hypothetical protein [Psychrobacillus antarcticus]